MGCSTCGCSPCQCVQCPPSVLNQPRIFNPTVSGGLFTNGVWQSATLNAPNINGGQITGATIDCTTQACTQAPGTCDGTIATTGYVCQAVNDAISGANPNFCAAVDVCLAGGPSTCTLVINCINTNIGSIFNPAAFDPSVYADTVQYGVTRYATIAEVQGASALLAIDPATLGAFWSAGGPNALWTAFEAGVCAAGASCFAPITSPVFLGDPQAPTPLPGDNDTSIATTAFVQAAITAGGFAPINNPVFTGDPQAPTPLAGDNDTSIATTAYVQNEINLLLAPTPAFCAAVGLCGYALLASPTFTGDPQSTTPAPGDNDNSIATTAFVQGEIATAMATITGGPISFSSTPVGNAAATETDAFLHNLTAGLLAANGDAWEFEAAGTFAATVSVDKRIRVYFGATIVFDSGNLAITSAETWRLTGTVVRTAAAAEKVAISLITSDGTIQAIGAYSTAAENTAVAQPVKLTINGTNANDVIAEFFRDRYVPA